MKPLVSVIIPTYNRPRLLTECLHALSLDPYKNIEVIVVNDAGSDPTPVTQPLQDRMKITIISLPINRGHVYARNCGLKQAEGEMIMLCDDDDIILPGHVARMVQAYRPEQDTLLYSDVEIVTYTHARGHREPMGRQAFAFDFDPTLLQKWNIIISSGILYPHRLHEQIGLFDEEMRDYWDWDFFLRVANMGLMRRIPFADVLYFVSAAGENLSSHPSAMQKSLIRFQRKHHLGTLPVSSFLLMTKEPSLSPYRKPSCVMWNGILDFS